MNKYNAVIDCTNLATVINFEIWWIFELRAYCSNRSRVATLSVKFPYIENKTRVCVQFDATSSAARMYYWYAVPAEAFSQLDRREQLLVDRDQHRPWLPHPTHRTSTVENTKPNSPVSLFTHAPLSPAIPFLSTCTGHDPCGLVGDSLHASPPAGPPPPPSPRAGFFPESSSTRWRHKS
jgi:hypothetical protein